jgi:endonuclease/exonuclease/phosphatase family metal-dependent hydrolase
MPTKRKKRNNMMITYNIQKFPWSMKTFNNITELLNSYSIILLQECYDDTYYTLKNSFPNYYICRDKLKGINLFSSGLVILSKYPIISYESHKFKNMNKMTLDMFSQKGFLIIWIKIKNQKICIINTHLQSSFYEKYDAIAYMQLKEILQYIKKIKEICIIGGDFNIDIMKIKELLYRYKTLEYIYPDTPTIYINFNNGHSVSSYRPDYDKMIFDYFIVRKSNKIKLIEPKTIECTYSDHNPVSCKIENL